MVESCNSSFCIALSYQSNVVLHLLVPNDICCCCSVSKLCLTLYNPMDCSMPGFPLLHHLPEVAQTHVHWVSDAISSSVIPFSSCLQSFLASGSFPVSQLFTSGGQSIGASVLASVLPMNIQGWFPLGLTGLISLLSNGLSRVFSSTTIEKHQWIWGLIIMSRSKKRELVVAVRNINTSGKTPTSGADLTWSSGQEKWSLLQGSKGHFCRPSGHHRIYGFRVLSFHGICT